MLTDDATTVITHGVKDMLADDTQTYTLTAHCTSDAHVDFIMTPPKRAPRTTWLVVICGCLSESNAEQPVSNFLVESILPVHEEDAKKVKASMLQFISLIVAGREPAQEKRENCVWTPEQNPLKLQKCRRLGRYPTGDEMQKYNRSNES